MTRFTAAGGLAATALLAACGGAADAPADPPAATEASAFDAARGERYVLADRRVVVRRGAEPTRELALPASVRTPRALWLDAANDVLYVGGDAAGGGGAIVAYARAHTTAGIDALPARTMLVDAGVAGLAVDTLRRRLYVADTGGAVRAYAGADTARGPLLPATTYPVLGSSLAVDAARDRLYVADVFAGLIVIDHASSPAAAVGATPGLAGARHVAYDAARDRAIVSSDAGRVVIEHASALAAR